MKKYFFAIIIGLVLVNCQPKNSDSSENVLNTFDSYFSEIEWKDTLNSKDTDWALGRLHEVKSPILTDSVFYSTLDTTKMSHKNWDNRFYAEGKISLPNNCTGYFVSRQVDDITYDRTTVLIIFDENQHYSQDLIFSEFIGYEGYITETQSKLFKNSDNNLEIESWNSESSFDTEKGEQVEQTKTYNWQFVEDTWEAK